MIRPTIGRGTWLPSVNDVIFFMIAKNTFIVDR
jgi:hypothetical protein